jgi:hypothetical protein
MTSMYPTGHPGMALHPYVTSMYPTRYSSFALDPYFNFLFRLKAVTFLGR